MTDYQEIDSTEALGWDGIDVQHIVYRLKWTETWEKLQKIWRLS